LANAFAIKKAETPAIIPQIKSMPSVTTAVTRNIAILDLDDEKISSIVALLKMRKLVPISTPAIAAVGI
jgi:hypothetical protein